MSQPKYNHREWIAKVRAFNAWLDEMAEKLRAQRERKQSARESFEDVFRKFTQK